TIVIYAGSCVPNKKVVYLQEGVASRKIVSDSVIKSFPVKDFEYSLQPGDLLSIRISSLTPSEYNFFSETEQELSDPLLSGYLVDEDGNIEVPAVGLINVSGLSLKNAEDTIKLALQNFLQNPVVKVRILNFNVTILGEVNNPGTL